MTQGKNIIVFSDGMGNTAVNNRASNVFKMFEYVDLETKDVEQVVWHKLVFFTHSSERSVT